VSFQEWFAGLCCDGVVMVLRGGDAFHQHPGLVGKSVMSVASVVLILLQGVVWQMDMDFWCCGC